MDQTLSLSLSSCHPSCLQPTMPYQRSTSFSKTPAEIAEEFRSLLSGKTAADLPDLISATPLFLPVETKPEDGFRFLSEKKIRACPVFDGES